MRRVISKRLAERERAERARRAAADAAQHVGELAWAATAAGSRRPRSRRR